MTYRVKFYTNADRTELFAWYSTNNRDEAEALVRNTKTGYVEIERVVL